jgi:hypothetical protein
VDFFGKMPLTAKILQREIYHVHKMDMHFMKKNRTTYFIYPHEYASGMINCIGLFAFTKDKSIIFAVLHDGTIVEVTSSYFPQYMIMQLEERFKYLAMT